MYDVVNIQDLLVRYFSSTPWLIMYVISIIYLFFRLNTTGKRVLLAAVVSFFLVINAFVIRVFTNLGENSVFYRHLWAIPSFVIIGIAFVDLIRIIPKWYLRIPVVAAIAIFLWFVNQQEYIRCRDQVFSADAKMVPEDVIELGNELGRLRNEENKNVLFVVCPVAYERSYGNMPTELSLYGGCLKVVDSSILTDTDHNGEMELMGENPDIDFIMSTCCSRGMDYVIVSRQNNTENNYRYSGYEPIVSTEGFFLYRCEGFSGYIYDLNARDQVIWKSWYEGNRRAIENDQGYCTVEYEYDNNGKLLSEQFKGIEGNLINSDYGYARRKLKYKNGLLVESRNYDANGNLCLNRDMFAIGEGSYNRKGELTAERYYNEKGDLISEKYYETEDEHIVSSAGYDEVRRLYDDNHNVTFQGYYMSGKLVNLVNKGYAVIDSQYDEEGRIIQERYYNKDWEQANDIRFGYHKIIYKYNDKGLVIHKEYYDKDGYPIRVNEQIEE